MKKFLFLKKILPQSVFFTKVNLRIFFNLKKFFKITFLTILTFDLFLNYYYYYCVYKFFFFKFLKLKNFMFFILNFTRLQSFYSFIFSNFFLCKAFSSGVLLKYFFLINKKIRRSVQKHKPVFNFLKKFFFFKLSLGCEFLIYGFKKKFLPILFEFAT